MKLGSNVERWGWLCISVWIMSRHSDWGIDGYRLVTSIDTRIALSGTVKSCRMRESAVEFCT